MNCEVISVQTSMDAIDRYTEEFNVVVADSIDGHFIGNSGSSEKWKILYVKVWDCDGKRLRNLFH